MRTIPPGNGSPAHCDVIFMGRGTTNLYTAWVPFGDIPLNVGGLLLLEGSLHNEHVLESYCTLDYDSSCQNRPNENPLKTAGFESTGALSNDMALTRDTVGGRLMTAEEYKMGDLLIFSVYTVHGSLDNQSREVRLSTDSRYQLACEPLDERWIGEHPPGHGGTSVRGMIC
jgi:ectoine hydroxylase-related dioxygenase (phytanoyl-CoA dioxygenase family)